VGKKIRGGKGKTKKKKKGYVAPHKSLTFFFSSPFLLSVWTHVFECPEFVLAPSLLLGL
jgi:hypothetical protein